MASTQVERQVFGGRDRRSNRNQLFLSKPRLQRTLLIRRPLSFPGQRSPLVVDLERVFVLEDHAVGVPCQFDSGETVKHISSHGLGVAIKRITVSAGIWLPELHELPTPERNAAHLGEQGQLLRSPWVLSRDGR